MATAVKLSDEVVQAARRQARVEHRSVSSQISYWAKLGKIAEDNPDLPFSLIREILLAKEEADQGLTMPYEFG